MKKSNFTGWKNVFAFEFEQAIKQKAFVIFLVVFCAIALFAQPVMRLLQNRDKQDKPVKIEKLYVCDETGFPISYQDAELGASFADLKIETVDGAFADAFANDSEEAAKNKKEIYTKETMARLSYSQESGSFQISFVKPNKTDYSKEDCEKLMSAFAAFFETEKTKMVDVSEEELASITAPVETKVLTASAEGEVDLEEDDDDKGISSGAYSIMLAGIMIITMLISKSGSQIATSIVTEKSTKVIEYMMTNIRPMALIIGKMLSAVAVTLIQLAAIGVCYACSNLITGVMFGTAAGSQEIQEATGGIMSALGSLNIGSILLTLVLWMLGIVFYCVIAGLCGASASKLEELGEAMKVYQILMILGAYLGLGACMMMLSGKGGSFLKLCCIFPLSAPFVGPASAIMGQVSIVYPLIGMVLLAVCCIFMFVFTAGVFEALIFYNGKTLKFKDILALAKTKKAKEGK